MKFLGVVETIEDFIQAHLCVAEETHVTKVKVVNTFLSDMCEHGFKVSMVGDVNGIKPIQKGDIFNAIKLIFAVEYAIVILGNGVGDTLLCHFKKSNQDAGILSDFSITSLRKGNTPYLENLLIDLIQKAENAH